MSDHKLCYNCGLRKEVSNFAYSAHSKDRLQFHCHECALKEERPLEAGQKRCPNCAKHLPKTDFGVYSRTRDGLKSHCKNCNSLMSAEARKERRKILDDFKSQGCQICGEKDIRVLEIDHKNRGTKGRTSGGRPIQFLGMKISELRRELDEKCWTLCIMYVESTQFFLFLLIYLFYAFSKISLYLPLCS